MAQGGEPKTWKDERKGSQHCSWMQGFTVFGDLLRFFQRQNNWIGWFSFLGLYCVNVALFMPGIVLILGAGFVFGCALISIASFAKTKTVRGKRSNTVQHSFNGWSSETVAKICQNGTHAEVALLCVSKHVAAGRGKWAVVVVPENVCALPGF